MADLKKNPGKILGAVTVSANEVGALNLGQGFPTLSDAEMQVSQRVKFLQNARDALYDPNGQQYKDPRGMAELREAIATSNAHYYQLETDPEKEMLVTQGACAAIYFALNTLLKEADGRNEVLLVEPFFNFYPSIINEAGGRANHFALDPDRNQEWVLDVDKLERSITPNTKVILLNSPMNPTGKVFSRAELEAIADVVQRHDLYVVCDEVYEFHTFDGQQHIPLATIEGIKDRCVRISSVGKTFSVTDWRVGYASGPEHIISRMANSHFFISCGVTGSFQHATAYGLGQKDFLRSLGQDYKRKSQILADGLKQAGFLVSPAQGGYFVSADYSEISNVDGVDFAAHMINEHGVAAVPFDPPFLSSDQNGDAAQFLRFCVVKPDRVLEDAVQRLQGINGPS